MKMNRPQNSLAHMTVLRIISDTEKRSTDNKEISKHIKNKKVVHVLYRTPKGERRPKAAASPLGGGRRPPVKDMDDLSFIMFDIF